MRKGWEVTDLGNVIEIKNGKNQKEVMCESGPYPIMGSAGNVMGYATDFICEAGTTIVGRKGNISKPIYINERIWTVDTAFGFYPKNKNVINKKFIFYLCLNIDFESMNRGTTIPSLVKSELQKIPIPLPPLPEQQRIVSILDEAFAAIANAKANAEQNLKNAKELFESYLQRVFENKGEGWEDKRLGEIIEIRNGKNQQAVLSETGGYKIMGSAGNVMGYASDFICEAGTTIIGRKGNISKPIYIEERFWNVDTAFGLYPKEENKMDKKFLYYLTLGIDFKSMNRGTTIPSLVKSELQTIKINFPKSIKSQREIVKNFDSLSAETKRLEAIYQQKIANLEELKKVILQRAFSGELKNKLEVV